MFIHNLVYVYVRFKQGISAHFYKTWKRILLFFLIHPFWLHSFWLSLYYLWTDLSNQTFYHMYITWSLQMLMWQKMLYCCIFFHLKVEVIFTFTSTKKSHLLNYLKNRNSMIFFLNRKNKNKKALHYLKQRHVRSSFQA